MAHERGPCREICTRDKKSCFHRITCAVVRQFKNGRWLIENRYGFVNAVDERNLIFEQGEYQKHNDPNKLSTLETTHTRGIGAEDFEEDFNAKLIRFKKIIGNGGTISDEINPPTKNMKLPSEGESGEAWDTIHHWSTDEQIWHNKNCDGIKRRGFPGEFPTV
jgi:hypothetical protein